MPGIPTLEGPAALRLPAGLLAASPAFSDETSWVGTDQVLPLAYSVFAALGIRVDDEQP